VVRSAMWFAAGRQAGGRAVRTKDWRVPALDQVPVIFSDDRVRALAAETRLSPLSDDELRRFAASIRARALVYIRDANTLSDDDIRREIEELYRAADRGDGEKTAELVRVMSKQTRAFLNKRAIRIRLKIPKPSAFLDRARRRAACETLRRLLSQGGKWESGRWVPLLYVPKQQLSRKRARAMVQDAKRRGVKIKVRRPKRQAERDFIMFLQVDYLNATGREPPVTARKSGTGAGDPVPGPFARFAQRCLDLLGADKADATGQINELQALRKRPSHGKRQKPNK
jgi:hypothetical protein